MAFYIESYAALIGGAVLIVVSIIILALGATIVLNDEFAKQHILEALTLPIIATIIFGFFGSILVVTGISHYNDQPSNKVSKV